MQTDERIGDSDMPICLRPATLDDAPFLANVVIIATQAQGRFPSHVDVDEFRAEYEEWSRETVLGAIPGCTLSVIEWDGEPAGRLRVVRKEAGITLAGIQLLPSYQNRGIGTALIEELKREAKDSGLPLYISVEKDNPDARRLYERLGCRLIGQDEEEYHLAYGG